MTTITFNFLFNDFVCIENTKLRVLGVAPKVNNPNTIACSIPKGLVRIPVTIGVNIKTFLTPFCGKDTTAANWTITAFSLEGVRGITVVVNIDGTIYQVYDNNYKNYGFAKDTNININDILSG